MNAINKLTRRLAAKFAFRGIFQGKASEDLVTGGWEALSGMLSSSDTDSVWSSFNSSDLEGVYRKHSIIFSCVRKVTTAAQEASLLIGKMDGDSFEPMPDHPLAKVLARPNPNMSTREYIAQVVAHLELTGDSYTWEHKSKGGQILEIWPVPSSWVKPRKNNDDVLMYYEVKWGNKTYRVLPEDMARMYLPDPANPTGGCGPMQAALHDYEMDVARENYLAEMVNNLKTPGLILKQEQGWTSEQKKEFREILMDKIGPGRRGSPLFLEGEKATIELMAPLKDLDWKGFTNLSESRICSVFGVPPILVGARVGLEHATYSNYDQADRSFYRETMVSLWLTLESAFTRNPLTNEGESPDLVFKFSLDAIRQLQENANEVADRSIKLFHGGLITRNRALEIVGEEQLTGPLGTMLAMPMGLVETPVDATEEDLLIDKPDPDEHEQQWSEDGSDEDETQGKATRKSSQAILMRLQAADKWMPSYRKRLRLALRDQVREVVERVEQGSMQATTEGMSTRWEKAAIDAKRSLVYRMVDTGKRIAQTEFGPGKKSLDFGLMLGKAGIEVEEESFILRGRDQNIEKWLEETSKLETRTSRKQMDKMFRDANAFWDKDKKRGWTPREIARHMLKRGLAGNKHRANLMARTGSMWSHNQGAQQTYREFGVTIERWIVTEDDVLCPWCMSMEGKIVGIDDPFLPEGESLVIDGKELAIPFDVQHAPLHPYCRCGVEPVLDTGTGATGSNKPKWTPTVEVIDDEVIILKPTPKPKPKPATRAKPKPKETPKPKPEPIADLATVPEVESLSLDEALLRGTAQIDDAVEQTLGARDAQRKAVKAKETLKKAQEDYVLKSRSIRHLPYDDADAILKPLRDHVEGLKAKSARLGQEFTEAKARVLAHGGKPSFKVDYSRSFTGKRLQRVDDGIASVMNAIDPKLIKSDKMAVRAGRGRSSATSKGINMTSGASSKTTAHEMAHWVESNNPHVLRRSAEFWEKRTQGHKSEWLGDRYDKGEKAKFDKFKHNYSGKVYRDAQGNIMATEILSMGVEQYIDDPIEFLRSDPDYFRFVTGVLKGII